MPCSRDRAFGITRLTRGQYVGTRLGDREIRRIHARECRPTALLNVGVLLPRTDLFELGHFLRGLGGAPELVSAHRGQHGYKRGARISHSHLLGSTLQRPSAPTEADDHCGEKAHEGSL